MHLDTIAIDDSRFPDKSRYPFNLPVFHHTTHVRLDTPITFFVGENGSGKSTLLRAVSRCCGIHIWSENVATRFDHNPYVDDLYKHVAVTWSGPVKPGAFFSAESYQHMTNLIEQWACTDPHLFEYFGGTSLLSQSHGESFMSFFRSRFALEGLYLLDEPESALSPRRQLAFLKLLQEMGAAGHAQFIVATHSPILLSCPGATILSFDGPAVARVPFESTDYYRVYRELLLRPEPSER